MESGATALRADELAAKGAWLLTGAATVAVGEARRVEVCTALGLATSWLEDVTLLGMVKA